jgi:nicotinate-nucleotide adenylyltransferase
MRLAVFGGSFDPPHVGHLLTVSYVLATQDVDRVMVVPCYQHNLGKQAGASFEDRLEMCRRMTADLGSRVMVSDIERTLEPPSRTFNTLTALQRFPEVTELCLVIGTDILTECRKWYRWDDIQKLARLLVIRRPGYPALNRSYATTPMEMPDISSTEVRRRLRDDEALDGLVPKTVIDYIGAKGLYPLKEDYSCPR